MYSGNKYELLDKFHIFTLKNQDDQQVCVSPVLDVINKERRLYGICLSVYDFIESTDEQIELNQQNRSKRTFWKYKKTYCFITYFPILELF
jgi:hypothetical protein